MSWVALLEPRLCASCVPACGLQGDTMAIAELRRQRPGEVKYLSKVKTGAKWHSDFIWSLCSGPLGSEQWRQC